MNDKGMAAEKIIIQTLMLTIFEAGLGKVIK
jgi:hypothetical protein